MLKNKRVLFKYCLKCNRLYSIEKEVCRICHSINTVDNNRSILYTAIKLVKASLYRRGGIDETRDHMANVSIWGALKSLYKDLNNLILVELFFYTCWSCGNIFFAVRVPDISTKFIPYLHCIKCGKNVNGHSFSRYYNEYRTYGVGSRLIHKRAFFTHVGHHLNKLLDLAFNSHKNINNSTISLINNTESIM